MIKEVQHLKKRGNRHTLVTLVSIFSFLLTALFVFYAQLDLGWEVNVQKRELPIYAVQRSDNKIAISFDAAWGGSQTEDILDILDAYDVKTTFFVVNTWVKRFPQLTKMIVERGHEIGNHSTTHKHMSKLTESQIIKELNTVSDHVEALTNIRPTLFRPPYGDYNNRVISVSRKEGYECVQWSVDSLDWKNYGTKSLIDQSTKNVQGGDIVLFHNDSKYIVQALPAVLKSYKEQGLCIVKVSDLLLKGDYYLDHQGKQHALQAPEGR